MAKGRPYILMLEDDSDDRYITESFFAEKGYDIQLKFVEQADEVLQYLEECCDSGAALPRLLLLDKTAPGNTFELLRELKSNRAFCAMPVVMISGSDYAPDIRESYRLGVSSYIVKPSTAGLTAKKIASFVTYWFETVELPEVISTAAAY